MKKRSNVYQKIISSIIAISVILFFPLFPNSLANEKNSTSLENNKRIHSKNYLIFDRNSKNVIIDRLGFEKVPMASTTKIMTCILAIENGNLDDIVTISNKASKINGSKLKLQSNSTIKLEDLLYGLMLRSGNDAAIAVAEHISGSYENFIALMNNKATELNLQNTHFTSPHGLDNNEHFTTCYELAVLTDYALNNPTFKKIVSTYNTSIYLNNSISSIHNTNNLLEQDKHFYGVKTGFTFNAGRCLVSAYKKNNIDIIIVALNSNTNNQRTSDTINLKDYILNNYEPKSLKIEIKTFFKNFIQENKELYFKSIPESKITLSDDENKLNLFLLKKNSNISYKINVIPILSYNNFIGEKIGTFNIYENNNLIKTIDINLSSKIKKLEFNSYFYMLIKNII